MAKPRTLLTPGENETSPKIRPDIHASSCLPCFLLVQASFGAACPKPLSTHLGRSSKVQRTLMAGCYANRGARRTPFSTTHIKAIARVSSLGPWVAAIMPAYTESLPASTSLNSHNLRGRTGSGPLSLIWNFVHAFANSRLIRIIMRPE